MGRSSTTWRKGQGGRPHGAKDAVPRSKVASIKRLIAEVVLDDEAAVKETIRRGLQDARMAHHYLRIAADYLDGRPAQAVEVHGHTPVRVVFGGRFAPRDAAR